MIAIETPGTLHVAHQRGHMLLQPREIRGESFLGQRSRRPDAPNRIRGGEAHRRRTRRAGTARRPARRHGPRDRSRRSPSSAAQRMSGSSCCRRRFHRRQCGRCPGLQPSQRAEARKHEHIILRRQLPGQHGAERLDIRRRLVERNGRAPALLREPEANASRMAGNAEVPIWPRSLAAFPATARSGSSSSWATRSTASGAARPGPQSVDPAQFRAPPLAVSEALRRCRADRIGPGPTRSRPPRGTGKSPATSQGI